jgi:hypothetical protein
MLILKSQLLRIHACTSVTNQEEIEEWFPELFKPKLEVGKVYRYNNSCVIVKVTGLTDNDIQGYGINYLGVYCNNKTDWTDGHDGWKEVVIKDWQLALVTEAIKQGFVSGCHHKMTNRLGTIKSRGDNYGYIAEDNKLLFNNYSIFEKGVWAKVLPEMTLEEAEKKFQCKITLNK